MTMIAGLLLLGAEISSGMTLAEAQALPPELAGDRLLEGQTHGRVATIQRVKERYIGIPGQVEYDLIEVPVQAGGRCLRRTWRAAFRYAYPGKEIPETTMFQGVHLSHEVGLPASNGCEGANYAHLNGASEDEAFSQLRLLQDVVAGKRKVTFCWNQAGPPFCDSPATIRAELKKRPAWAISKSEGRLELWLGNGDGLITTVRIDQDRPDDVSVVQKLPAPF